MTDDCVKILSLAFLFSMLNSFYVELITDSHAALRNKTERSHLSY